MAELTKVENMFAKIPINPPDSIFGLIESFKRDPREDKVNLCVGVYQNESGKTPILKCVSEAEKILLEQSGTKSYLPIDGMVQYNSLVANLILGDEISERSDVHSVTAQTPGGTAALRVSAELLQRIFSVPEIWISDPTWANHRQIYDRVGLNVKTYDYLDERGTGLDFEKMMGSLEQMTSGSGLLLHTVCHNPTGVDLSTAQWQDVFSLIMDKRIIPVFDFAYQGFGHSVESDAEPIRQFCAAGGEGLICNSFSKNFGLYGERVGGITAFSPSEEGANALLSQIKSTIRTMYSNPPLHGGAIVSTVLNDAQLRALWEEELAEMRARIIQLRADFVKQMGGLIPDYDFEYVNRQRGMFSYSGLSKEQVKRLKDDHGIYALGTGRINIAGLRDCNIDRICRAISAVM